MSTPNTNNPSVNITRVDQPVPLHAKVKRQASGDDGQLSLDTELLKITASDLNEPLARQSYRKLAMLSSGGLGACHLIKSGGQWRLMADGKTGRAPKPEDLESLQEICEQVYADGKSQITSLECLDALQGVLAPINVAGQEAELLLLVNNAKRGTARSLSVVQHVVTAMKLWLGRKSAAEATWQVGSLASIIELVGKIETSATVEAAAEEVVNATLRRTGASVAAIAFRKKADANADLKLAAVSGVQKLDHSSQISRDYLQALTESSIRGEQAICPAINANNDHLLCAHQQALVALQEQAIISQPLVTSDGIEVGVWCFAGMQTVVHQPGMSRFVSAASPHVADAISASAASRKVSTVSFGHACQKENLAVDSLDCPLGHLGARVGDVDPGHLSRFVVT